MDESQLLNWFRDHLTQELGIRKECVTAEADLQRDLGADSHELVLLIMNIEDEFQITISDEEAGQIATVRDAIGSILGKLPGPSAAGSSTALEGGALP